MNPCDRLANEGNAIRYSVDAHTFKAVSEDSDAMPRNTMYACNRLVGERLSIADSTDTDPFKTVP
jgi:hypothetical protein